jgi:hypothetical protein
MLAIHPGLKGRVRRNPIYFGAWVGLNPGPFSIILITGYGPWVTGGNIMLRIFYYLIYTAFIDYLDCRAMILREGAFK